MFNHLHKFAVVAVVCAGLIALSSPVAHADWHGGGGGWHGGGWHGGDWHGGGGWGWHGGGWGCCWRGGVFVGVAPPVYAPPPAYYYPPPAYYPPPYYTYYQSPYGYGG